MTEGRSTLGRTNRAFPPVWLRLAVPEVPHETDWAQALCTAALDCGVPLDISTQPALWGGHIRGSQATLLAIGGSGIERATDHRHAADLIQADLLQLLSSIGRDFVDLYFLRHRGRLEEYQIGGALESFEMARQEGHIQHLGLFCDGEPQSALGMWQFHDAFEFLMVNRSSSNDEAFRVLSPIAQERRVGVVARWDSPGSQERLPPNTDGLNDYPFVLTVRTPEEVRSAVARGAVSKD